jgi:hypothetical protein
VPYLKAMLFCHFNSKPDMCRNLLRRSTTLCTLYYSLRANVVRTYIQNICEWSSPMILFFSIFSCCVIG